MNEPKTSQYEESERKKLLIDPIKIGTDLESGLTQIYDKFLVDSKDNNLGSDPNNNIYRSRQNVFTEGFNNKDNIQQRQLKDKDRSITEKNINWSFDGFIQYIIELITHLFVNGEDEDDGNVDGNVDSDRNSTWYNRIAKYIRMIKQFLNKTINEGDGMSMGVIFIMISFVLFFIDITS